MNHHIIDILGNFKGSFPLDINNLLILLILHNQAGVREL